jgi:hypothetical protein
MYCSNCGNPVNDKLKYCNGCGDRLAKEEDKHGTPGKMLDNILTTIFLVVMFGLGILVGLVAVLLDKGTKTEVVTTIVVAYLAAVFGICFMLLRQVPKLVDAKLNRNTSTSSDFVPAQQLKPRTTAQLEEYQQPIMSVTEHTTRTLEEIPQKRS